MNFGFKNRIKKEFDHLNSLREKNRPKKNIVSILSFAIAIFAIIVIAISYISINTSWFVFIVLIIAEVFGHTHPLFSLTSISILGTPFLMLLFGFVGLLTGMGMMLVAELIDIEGE